MCPAEIFIAICKRAAAALIRACPTLLFFRADDVDLLERISRTAGYIAPVESVR